MTKKEKIKRENWLRGYRDSTKKHFKKRFFDRVGFEVTEELYRNLTDFFKKKPVTDAVITSKDTRSSTIKGSNTRRKWYLIQYKSQDLDFSFWCLWDKSSQVIITALNKEDEPNSEPTDLVQVMSNEFYAQFEEDES